MIKNKKIFVFTLVCLVGLMGIFYNWQRGRSESFIFTLTERTNYISRYFLYNRGAGSIVIESEHELAAVKVDIEEDIDEGIYPANLLSGVRCENHSRRPYVVMLAEDHEARPLSGIGFADLVVEMPVVTDSITRIMAVFVCNDPEELGSVRSARYDFISLALGYDAIFAHWGGEKLALDSLNKGIIDNLDALPNYFNTFYRKRWISAPHNGFTSMERMINAAEKLGYRMTSEFEGYRFLEVFNDQFSSFNDGERILDIGYAYPYNVRYKYNTDANSYLRWRAGLKEIDKLTGEQVEAKNIVVMVAESRQVSKDYNDVDVLGGGDAVVYRNGEELRGNWQKRSDIDVLRFFDDVGKEIKFVPGSIWIEIVEPTTEVIEL